MVTVAKRCPFTGAINEMTFNVDELTFAEGYLAYTQGALIQDAFPFLDASEREFVKTGITPAMWASIFGPEED